MQKDMTSGPVREEILAFALPVMGSNLLQVTYTMTDSLIIGNFIGGTALGAVGLVGSAVWLLTTLCTSLGTGLGIAAAQFFGAEKKEDIRETAAAGYLLSALLSVLVFALCVLFADPLIRGFLKAPEEMQAASRLYFLIIAGGGIFQYLYNTTYGLLRAHGDSSGAMLFLLVSALLNVFLDLLLVVRIPLGVAGAAAATVAAEAGAAAASMRYLRKRYPQFRSLRGLRRDRVLAKARLLMRLSIPIALQSSVTSVCFIILQRLINSFGAASIVGYSAMGKIENFSHIPSQSFNAALAAFTGQNVGAGKFHRAKEGWHISIRMGVLLCAVLSLLILFNDTRLLGLFGISGEALRRGREHLDLLMLFVWVNTIMDVSNGFLQGAGDVRTPALATLTNLAVRLGLSFALALTPVSWRCYFLSMPPAWVLACLVSVSRCRGEKWKSFKIR